MKKAFICIAFIAITLTCLAQGTTQIPDWEKAMLEPDADFYTIRDNVEAYFTANPDASEDGPYVQFQRWAMFWENKVYNNYAENKRGSFDEYFQALASYVDRGFPCQTCNNQLGNWTCIGPLTQPNPTNQETMGIVGPVYVDPTNQNNIYIGTPRGGLFKSTNGGATWMNPVADPLPGFGVQSIAVDPTSNNQTLYVATSFHSGYYGGYGFGVLKSTDGGVHWNSTALTMNPTSLWANYSTYNVTINPQNPNVLYAVTDKNVYKTIDGFQSVCCTLLTAPNGGFRYLRLDPVNPNIIYVSGQGCGLWMSQNGGTTWQQLDDQTQTPSFIPPPSPDAANPNYLSTDLVLICPYHTVSPAASGLYATIYYKYYDTSPTNYITDLRIKYYDLTTNQWATEVTPDVPGYDLFEVNQKDPNIVYIGFGGGIVRKSVDAGITFSLQSSALTTYNGLHNSTWTHADIRYILLYESNIGGTTDKLYISNDGGVLKSLNGGTDWTNINGTGLSNHQFWGLGGTEQDANLFVTGAQDNGVMTYRHGAWSCVIVGDGYDYAIDHTDPNICFGYANINSINLLLGNIIKKSSNLLTSAPNFSTWSTIPKPPGMSRPRRPLHIDESNNWYSGYHDVFRSSNQGGTWTITPGGKKLSDFSAMPPPSDVYVDDKLAAIAVAPSDNNIIYAAYEGPVWWPTPTTKKFFWTRDADVATTPTWEDIGQSLNLGTVANPILPLWGTGITGIAVDPNNPYRIWLTFDDFRSSASDPECGEQRVIYGEYNPGPQTWTWQDYSEGLPRFGVLCIAYQKGSNDALYIGTEVGIFYRDASMSQWECFQNNLPVGMVTDLDINYCGNLIRATVLGRGIWQSPLAPIAIESISANTTWTANRSLLTDLHIQTGATLTISTCTINIAAGKKIVVEPGGRLVVNGAVLTNGCGVMWKGIEVWSDQTLNQFGRITVSGNAVIENAEDAIRTWKPGDYTTSGGVVACSNSLFINNKRSIEFVPYPTYNGSFFTGCTFNVNDLYQGGSSFYAHVTLNGVTGIRFQNCTFENARTNVSSSNLLGYGIYSLDANFLVGPTCDVSPGPNVPCPPQYFHQSLFKGLETGIYATNSTSTRNFSVDQSLFENNFAGINIVRVDKAVVTRNTFTIGGNPTPNPFFINLHTGLILNSSTRYRVEENVFSKAASTPANVYTLGVWANNTTADENQIYKNDFNSLMFGCYTQAINRSSNGVTGLQFLCNTYQNITTKDIIIDRGSPPNIADGIRFFQGNDLTSTSAGNAFSYNGQTEGSISNVSGQPITYLFHPSGPPQEPQNYTPVYVAISLVSNDNTCASNFGTGHSYPLSAAMIQQLTEDYDENESAYLNVLYNYNQLIDDGNTNALLEEMEISWSSDAWTLRAELLERSPYLSEEVLREAAATGVLPNAMLLEVCLANSDATKSDAFIGFLQTEIPNPMPSYMTDLIMATWEGVTPRTVLEGSLGSYGHRMAFAGNILLTDLLLDVENDRTEDMRYWLDRIQTLSAKYALCESYFEHGQLTEAGNILSAIPEDFNLKDEELEQYNRYVEYFNFRKNIMDEGKNLMQLDAAEVSQLETFANASNDLPGVMAQNLLCFGYHICTEYISGLPGEGGGNRISHPFSGNAKGFYNEVKVTPNPATDFVAFAYDLPLVAKHAVLSITDLTGRTVQEFTLTDKKGQVIWDTRIVTKGVYLYYIKGDSSELTRGKILINKN